MKTTKTKRTTTVDIKEIFALSMKYRLTRNNETDEQLLELYEELFLSDGVEDSTFAKIGTNERLVLVREMQAKKEAEIREAIFVATGQIALPVGMKVKDISTGQIGTITKVIRFEDITFQKDWYHYVLDTDTEDFRRNWGRHYSTNVIPA